MGERLPQIPNALQRRLRNPSLCICLGVSLDQYIHTSKYVHTAYSIHHTSYIGSAPPLHKNHDGHPPAAGCMWWLAYLKVEPGIVAGLVGDSDELVDRHLR